VIRFVAIVLATLLAVYPGWAQDASADARSSDELLLGKTYPIEVSVSFHTGLLHWLDSLAVLNRAGATAGKTIPAHREEYEKVLGRPTGGDKGMLQRYRSARLAGLDSADATERNRLTVAFFEATDLDGALERAAGILDPISARSLATAMRHFVPRYQRIWRNGRVPREFLDRVRVSERREDLARLLAGVAGFFGVSPTREPHPQLVLVPVPAGFGTHAQAIGRYLLIEIRPDEGLSDEIGPIVHENAHLLIYRIPPARLEALGRTAIGEKPWGPDAWAALNEALPTAIAQGVAHQSFRRETWSIESDWYDQQRVDEYAKRIFPLVKEALSGDGSFDESFVKQLVHAYR